MDLKQLNPMTYLEEISLILTNNGGLVEEAVDDFVKNICNCNGKLVPMCMAINVISATDEKVQLVVCKKGVWDILFKWLQDALKDENQSFVLELLSLYSKLPVTMDLLRLNSCPKLIKQLSKKDSESSFKVIAYGIIKSWKNVVASTNEVQKSKKRRSPTTDRPTSEPSPKAVKCDVGGTGPKWSDEVKSVEVGANKPDDSKMNLSKKKTVKMQPNHMRTAGLEEPQEIAQLKSRTEVLAKKGLATKPTENSKASVDAPIESYHQKITMAPEKRRPSHEIHESSSFIDSLTISQPALKKKKRKIESSTSTKTPKKDEDQANAAGSTDGNEEEPGSEPKKSSLADIAASFSNDKAKKRVTWAIEENLQTVFYFELDETERVNVNRVSMEEMKKKEHQLERQNIFGKKLLGDADRDTNSTGTWYRPEALEGIPNVVPGARSVERHVQAERELRVLQAIYFTKESIPDSPAEPDPEPCDSCDPTIMPLDDLTVDAAQSDASGQSKTIKEELIIFTKSEGDGKEQMSLNPELADLVKSLAANISGQFTVPIPISSTGEPLGADGQSALGSVIATADTTPPPASTPAAEPMNTDSSATQQPLVTEMADLPPSSAASCTSADERLQHQLWEIILENHPDLNVTDLTVERVRELLEPLQDQLVTRGIFTLPQTFWRPPPVAVGVTPHFRPQGPPGPHGYGPPMFMRPGVPLPPGFTPRPPHMGSGFMPCPVGRGGPVPFTPRQMGGMGMPPMAPMAPMPPRFAPRQPPPGICRFYQLGTCRHGVNCRFYHPRPLPPQAQQQQSRGRNNSPPSTSIS